MESIIGAIIGLVVACMVIHMYRKGVRDGMGMIHGDAPAISEPPQIFTKKPEEPESDSIEEQYAAFMNYQPKYTEGRNAES